MTLLACFLSASSSPVSALLSALDKRTLSKPPSLFSSRESSASVQLPSSALLPCFSRMGERTQGGRRALHAEFLI